MLNPEDIIAAGGPTDIKLCPNCIDAYRNGIEPGESACEAKYTLLSSQGTACAETVLNGHEYLSVNRRIIVENKAIRDWLDDCPIPGTWTDVKDNDAL